MEKQSFCGCLSTWSSGQYGRRGGQGKCPELSIESVNRSFHGWPDIPNRSGNYIENINGQWILRFTDEAGNAETTIIYRPNLVGFTPVTWAFLNTAMGGFGMWLTLPDAAGNFRVVNVEAPGRVVVFPPETMDAVIAWVDSVPNPAGGNYIMLPSPPP